MCTIAHSVTVADYLKTTTTQKTDKAFCNRDLEVAGTVTELDREMKTVFKGRLPHPSKYFSKREKVPLREFRPSSTGISHPQDK